MTSFAKLNQQINPIFEGKRFAPLHSVPPRGLLGRAVNPRQGFEPFKTDQGTEVLFVNHPKDLGPFAELTRPRWRNTVNWILARNECLGLFGIRADHTLVRCPLFRDEDPVWRSLGGTMVRNYTYPLLTGIADVADKSTAMSTKQMAVQQRQKKAGLPGEVRVGGGKTILWTPEDPRAAEAAIEEFGSVMETVGSSFSAVDEGLTPAFMLAFCRTAKTTFIGAPAQAGLMPALTSLPASETTAKGIIAGLEWYRHHVSRDQEMQVTVLGAGGVGGYVVDHLIKSGSLFAVIEADPTKLFPLKKKSPKTKLVLNEESTRKLFTPTKVEEFLQMAKDAEIRLAADLVQALTIIGSGATVFSPNGAAHVYSGEVPQALVYLGYYAGIGAANNPYPPHPRTGDPYRMADYLQRYGYFGPGAEHLNLGGLTRVLQPMLGLTEEDIECLMQLAGEGLGEEYFEAFKKNRAPQRYRDEEAHRDWIRHYLNTGLGIGWEPEG